MNRPPGGPLDRRPDPNRWAAAGSGRDRAIAGRIDRDEKGYPAITVGNRHPPGTRETTFREKNIRPIGRMAAVCR
jgi:hypothetical protein